MSNRLKFFAITEYEEKSEDIKLGNFNGSCQIIRAKSKEKALEIAEELGFGWWFSNELIELDINETDECVIGTFFDLRT